MFRGELFWVTRQLTGCAYGCGFLKWHALCQLLQFDSSQSELPLSHHHEYHASATEDSNGSVFVTSAWVTLLFIPIFP